jgi:hypothetical protein
MNSYIVTDYLIASSQTWALTSTTTSSESTARTARSKSDMSQLPILGPTDKSSAPTGWCSTLSRSGYMMMLTPKEASGSRNYPLHSECYVLSLPSQWGNPLTSWSTAPKQSSLLMSYRIHQQWSTTTKASLKTADESTSMDSKKLAALPSSNEQGTWRVSDATTTATSRNAPSTLAISSSVVSRTRKDYTSSAPLGKVPSQSQR